jgi:hypothetical protein
VGLSNLLAVEKPKLASDLFRGRLFDFYRSYGRLPENAEMVTLSVPTRGNVKHPYGEKTSSDVIEALKQALSALTKAEPQNRDAHFDFALVSMLGESRGYGDAVNALKEALGRGDAPDSKRDLPRLVSNSLSFVPLFVHQITSQSDFLLVLERAGSTEEAYRRRVGEAPQYFSYGY